MSGHSKLFSKHEVYYMELRYPKVAIKVHEDENVDPTEWGAKSCIWKYK